MLAVAHRTPASPALAAELVAEGAAYFEVDVMLDGPRVIVSHYLPVLGVRGWLERDGHHIRWHRRVSPDPLLLTLLEGLPAQAQVLLDPKEAEPARRDALRERLVALLPDPSRFTVSTENPADLAAYRAAGFGTWRTIGDENRLAEALRSGPLPEQGISIRHDLVTPATSGPLGAISSRVVAWTVNDVDRARALAELGVHGLTTDRVEVMRWVAANG